MKARAEHHRIWLQWYKHRIEQWLERVNLPQEEALRIVRNIPSSEDRTALIDSYVDPDYRMSNQPIFSRTKTIS